MNKIYYSSDEMFSSTDLIRKSKPIFDLITKKSIDKAVILRDGKPSFILLDFLEYEKLMKDYISLKEQNCNSKSGNPPIQTVVQNEIYENKITAQEVSQQEISDNEYKKASIEIDNLRIEDDFGIMQKAPLKEFWDE